MSNFRILSTIVLIAICGCATATKPPVLKTEQVIIHPLFDPTRTYTVEVREFELSPRHVELIRDSLAYLPAPILNTLVPFEISGDEDHFGGEWVADAHYCSDADKICIYTKGYAFAEVIWHESMHSFDTQLENAGRSPIENWERIAGDVYDEDCFSSKRDFTKDGLLTSYSRYDAWEDRAEFFTNCLKYLYGKPNAISGHDYFRSDQRYLEKLNALKDEGLFTDAQYERLKPLFE